MKLKYTKDGKAYCELTDEETAEIEKAAEITCFYIVDGKDVIAPPDCEHEFKIESGLPRNIKYCTKCIYWTFTYDKVCHRDTLHT